MMRGSAGGWVGGRTVTVITREVTASGGLGAGWRCQFLPQASQAYSGTPKVSGIKGAHQWTKVKEDLKFMELREV